jgi:ABC-type phosphate transport system substrate-binding protein
MGRLIKLTKHAVASGLALGASVLAQGLFIQTAQAAIPVTGPCSGLTNPVYISGSSAVKPVLAGLSQTIAATTTLVYFSNGSCTGVQAILGTAQTASNGTYWVAPTVDNPTGETQCTLAAAQAVDVGVSDVFATTCPGVTQAQVTAAGVGDFDTFFAQVMEFVVPFNSDQTAISAEAAYLTFGLGDQGATPWNNQMLYAIRNNTSGTQAMLGKAIKLDASKWIGTDKGGSGGVVTAIGTPTGDPKKTIGILSSGEADPATATIKKLAFQGYGQTCAFWADSGVAEKDKKYVRDGHYPVWGPLHVLAKVNAQGVATDAKAKALIDLFAKQDQAIVDVEINANVVPLCAMNVARTTEVGPMMSVQPTGACGCYFDSKRKTGGAGADCKVCTAATEATDCTGAAKHCNYGFCEVK